MLHNNYSKQNTLLVRGELGRGKPATYDLPNNEFRYGIDSGVLTSMHAKE